MYFVITSTSIWRLCSSNDAIKPWAVYPRLELPDGEEYKSLQSVELIWQFLIANNAHRDDIVVNVGGGVVSDLGGFAASTYMRGMKYINIPTTLLSMVDASIGGKTGFDYMGLKNSIGSFAQPSEVLLYPNLVKTLPIVEVLSGYGEMLKHGLLDSQELWVELLKVDLETVKGIENLIRLIPQSQAVKKRIVGADEKEGGLRRALNLGHTIGHALEAQALEDGHPIAHGYCVVWGMVCALYLSVVRYDFPKDILHSLEQVMYRYYGRPVCKCDKIDVLIDRIKHDKKNTEQGMRFVLLKSIGNPVVDEIVDDQSIRESIEYLFSL